MSAGAATPDELRCLCGNLIARVVGGKLEIKCRRCQRFGLIDLAAARVDGASIEIEWLAEPARTKSK